MVLEPVRKLEPLYTLLNDYLPDETEYQTDEYINELEGIEYVDLQGGRGSGKTMCIAELFVMLMSVQDEPLLCGREYQKSIEDSVYSEIVDAIYRLEMDHLFEIRKTVITCKCTKSYVKFEGLASAVRNKTIKGYSKFKYFWYEEAETATIDNLRILDPTFRQPGRILFFVRNAVTLKDAVPEYLNEVDQDLVYRIHINYDENEKCPDVLLRLAEACKENNPAEYRHTWLGQPRQEDPSTIVIPFEWLLKCVDLHKKITKKILPELDENTITDINKGMHGFRKKSGFDVADSENIHADENAQAVRGGPTLGFNEKWKPNGPMHNTVDRAIRNHTETGFDHLVFDVIGVGAAVRSDFSSREEKMGHKIGFTIKPFSGAASPEGKEKFFIPAEHKKHRITNGAYFANAKAQAWWNLRLRVENSVKIWRRLQGDEVDIDRPEYFFSIDADNVPDINGLMKELSQATYKYNNLNKIVIDKQPCLKDIVNGDGEKLQRRSPNRADAAVMAYQDDCINGIAAYKPKPKKIIIV